MGQIVAVVNQKGGVGKTTVTLGLAAAAMAKGHRTLVVDMDPQGAATWVLGIDPESIDRSVADVVGAARGASAKNAIMHSEWSHLVDVVPSTPALQDLEVLRGGLESLLLGSKTTTRLRGALQQVSEGYGVVLIDCPPSLGALTTNALTAATHALIVAEPTALSLRGVGPVADLIESVWERDNQWLDLAGVIVNRVPSRSHDAEVHYDELAHSVGKSAVWKPSVPQRVVLAEAAAARQPLHAMGSRASDVTAVFDKLYAKLWRLIKPARTG
jgi:cellulose biosynthesis protein BcsQ